MIIEIKDINVVRKCVEVVFNHIKNGFITKSRKPINTCRTVYNKILIIDGYHRLIQAIFLKKKTLETNISTIQCEVFLCVNKIDIVSLNGTMKYNGLETLIKRDELDKLYGEIKDKLELY